MQTFVFIVFGFFVFMLFVIGLYFSLALMQKNYSNKIVDRKIKEIRALFRIIMFSDLSSQLEALMSLKKYFSNSNGVEAFRLAFVGCSEDQEITDTFRKSLATVVDFKKIYKTKNVKLSYRKIYVLNIISELHLGTDKGNAFALENLSDDSLYVRNSALKVIQNQTDINVMARALTIMNEEKGYYNIRFTLDILDNFRGSQEALDQVIIDQIDQYQERLRTIVLNHFINRKDDNPIVKDKLLSYLQSSSNPETLLLCSRYFSRVIDPKAKDYIFSNLSHQDWRVRAVCVHAIANYSDDVVIETLKEMILDGNYFVRRACAVALLKLLDKSELFYMATSHENKRVREILVYSFETEKTEGFKDYKFHEFMRLNSESAH